MTQYVEKRPAKAGDNGPVQMTGQRPIEPHESALLTAAFCMMTFAIVAWALYRMWERPEHDWQMLGPVFAVEIIMPGMAIIAICRWVVLRKRAGLPINPQRVIVVKPARSAAAPARSAAPAKATAVKRERRENKPAQVVATAPMQAAPVDQVDIDLVETVLTTFVYPDVPAELGEPFQAVMQIVRRLPGHPNILEALAAKYSEAFAGDPDFRKAESFVIGKAERHPAYDPDAYADPIKTTNPALYLAQADEILPYAATVAAMVLIADQLPERVWDLLAGPWEQVGLGLPQVVLA